ncbi:MAG: hypothetical protein COA84_04740 [Robiginitomaculum sp.]|nr:MAG: hypothetical protein COA84_04740 [Robiginitomaculum sp.]
MLIALDMLATVSFVSPASLFIVDPIANLQKKQPAHFRTELQIGARQDTDVTNLAFDLPLTSLMF